MRILREPDPPGKDNSGGKNSDDQSAADLAAKGKTAREVALEKRISVLEDERSTLDKNFKDLLKQFEEVKPKTPAPAPAGNPLDQILDQVNEYLGCGLA